MCCISLCSSQKPVSDNSSATEESGNFENVLMSPGKQRHFQHRCRNLIPKNVGTELFTVSLVLNVQY
jgi:Neuraminidase (sialidase)